MAKSWQFIIYQLAELLCLSNYAIQTGCHEYSSDTPRYSNLSCDALVVFKAVNNTRLLMKSLVFVFEEYTNQIGFYNILSNHVLTTSIGNQRHINPCASV